MTMIGVFLTGGSLRRICRRFGVVSLGAAMAMVAGLLLASRAEAVTIKTYTFTQSGYKYDDGTAADAILHGSFTGIVNSSGLIETSGLTDFQMELTFDPGTPSAYTVVSTIGPTLFSFDTLSSPNSSGGNSSLSIYVFGILGYPAPVCVGSATPFYCAAGANGAVKFFRMTTTAFAHVNLVTAVTPIPATLVLFGTALAGLGLVGARASRRVDCANGSKMA